MNWASASDFWAMGGYGFYVWGSYAVTLACLLAEIALVRSRFGSVLKRLGRMRLAADRGGNDET
jgi:heme exporter protein D